MILSNISAKCVINLKTKCFGIRLFLSLKFDFSIYSLYNFRQVILRHFLHKIELISISCGYFGVSWANTSQAFNTEPGTLENVSNDDDYDKNIIAYDPA